MHTILSPFKDFDILAQLSSGWQKPLLNFAHNILNQEYRGNINCDELTILKGFLVYQNFN